MAKNPISKQSPDSLEESLENNQAPEQPETQEATVTGETSPVAPEAEAKPKSKSPRKDGDDSQTVDGYEVPAGEEMFFHAEIEQPNYDRVTGDRLSEPFITKQNPGEFANFIKFNADGKPQYFALGYRMHRVLHVPSSKYLAGARVESVKNKKQVFVSMSEAIEMNKQFLTKPKKS